MRTKKAQIDALRTVPLFEGLSTRDLQAVMNEMREDNFRGGASIVKEGDPGGRFYLIVDGFTELSVKGKSAGQSGPGGFFGEISLIDKGPRSATVIAKTDVRALSVASHNFLGLLEEHPGMARKVMIQLCRTVRTLDAAQS